MLARAAASRAIAAAAGAGRVVAAAAAPARLSSTWKDDRHSERINKREAASEAVYFNKEEEKLLRKLLGKVKTQAETAEPGAATASGSVERQRLEAIIGKYKVSDEDKTALLEWRHSHDF